MECITSSYIRLAGLTYIYGRTCYFESQAEIGSRLRSLVRSWNPVDTECVLIPEKRYDNDAHIIAHLHLRRRISEMHVKLSASGSRVGRWVCVCVCVDE